jgi:uncharacterized protein (TIGR02147 family)
MRKLSVFSYSDYQEYLNDRLATKGEGRGQRSQLAATLKVQNAFVSRVLHQEAHFSLEHALMANKFLGHSEEESDYFLLLVQKAKAGTRELEMHFEKQIAKILERRQVIAERIQVTKNLSAEDQMTYYSAWYYSAIHMMLLVPRWREVESLANYLQLSKDLVQKALEFLVRTGLAKVDGGEYLNGASRIHLGKNSPILPRHHANWRMRATQAMDRSSSEDLFFSGPIALSEKDAAHIRELIMKFLEESEKIIRPSPEEAVFCLDIDYFRL